MSSHQEYHDFLLSIHPRPSGEWIDGPRGSAVIEPSPHDSGWHIGFAGHNCGAGSWATTLDEARRVACLQTGAEAIQGVLF